MVTFSPQDIQAVILSIKVATAATLISTPIGIFTAYLLVFTKIPGKTILEGLVNLPLVLPPVVVGFMLLLLLGSSGPFGKFMDYANIRIVFTLAGAIIASSIVGFPLLVRSVRIGMEGISRECIQASRVLRANRLDTVLSIILPLSLRAVIGGMTLMFTRSLGEFGATIILAGNIPGLTQTIPLAIYDYTSVPDGDRMALSLCAVSISLSFTVLLISEAGTKSFKRE